MPPFYEAFRQNLPCTFDKIKENKGKTHSNEKRSHSLTLSQGHSKNQKTMPQGAINMLSTKKRAGNHPINGV